MLLPFITVFALEWLFTGVGPDVYSKIGVLSIALAAYCASEGLGVCAVAVQGGRG